MNRLIRFYNQNRGFVILVAIIIALIIIIIQVLNGIVEKSEEAKKQAKLNNADNKVSQNIMNNNDVSPITGEKVENNQVYTDIIKQFVEYCNNKQYDEAYNMLTSDCKEQMYPTVDIFKENYVDKIFYINRMYTLQNWYDRSVGKTYYIKYTEDVLATGNVNSNNNKSDYITVTNNAYTNCLNINSFVGGVVENKQQTKNGLTIKVNKKYMYMDYTIFNIQIENHTGKPVCSDTTENISDTYIYDIEQVRYTALLNENTLEELIVKNETTSSINIKFDKRYSPDSRTLKGLVFNEIITNYDKYTTAEEEKNTTTFDIDIYV